MKALFRMVSLPYYQPSARTAAAVAVVVPGSLLSLMGRPSLFMQHHAAAAATGLSVQQASQQRGDAGLSGSRAIGGGGGA